MVSGSSARYRSDPTVRLPSLNTVVAIHSISLLITLILGMTLFFLQTPSIYLVYVLFLTGPIYSINLYYLVKYLDFMEGKIKTLLKELDSEIREQKSSSELSSEQRAKLTANNYLLNSAFSEVRGGMMNRRFLYISMFTPVWPFTFYYALYRLFGFISIFEDLTENYLHSDPHSFPSNKGSKGDDNIFFKTSQKHKILFTSFALISIIGFALTFYMISVGFFALFWIVLLHKRLSGYVKKGGKETTSFMERPERKYLDTSLVIAFLCFGATSGFLAMFSNTFYMSLSSPLGLISPMVLLFFVVSVIAPVIEEPVKVAGFFLIDEKRSKHIPLFYWAFFGMIAGFGFALIENYTYFQTFFLQFSTRDSLYLLLLRFSFPVHMIGSALAGLGIGLWRKKNSLLYLVLFVLLAFLIHGGYNFIVTWGGM